MLTANYTILPSIKKSSRLHMGRIDGIFMKIVVRILTRERNYSQTIETMSKEVVGMDPGIIFYRIVKSARKLSRNGRTYLVGGGQDGLRVRSGDLNPPNDNSPRSRVGGEVTCTTSHSTGNSGTRS